MCAELAHNLQHISAAHIDVVCGDSYRLLLQHRSLHGKGLILIDPPCDPYDLYMAWSLCLVKHVLKHWSGFSIIMWYPCLGQSQLQGLYSQAIALDVGDVLVAEFGTSGTVSLERSGVFIFAPSDEAEGWLHMQLQLLASVVHQSTVPRIFWLKRRVEPQSLFCFFVECLNTSFTMVSTCKSNPKRDSPPQCLQIVD